MKTVLCARRPAPGEQGAGGSRYFAAQGAGSAAASKRPKQAPAPPDRRALALQQVFPGLTPRRRGNWAG